MTAEYQVNGNVAVITLNNPPCKRPRTFDAQRDCGGHEEGAE
jgi:hypothetical protein